MRVDGIPVRDMEIRAGMSIADLMDAFYMAGGFTAKKLAVAERIVRRMRKESATVFLSFPAAIVATGVRGVIREMVRRRMVDVVITTCGTLDHDLARVWCDYYHGSFDMDDADLHRRGVHRLGNVLIPQENYGKVLEEHLQPMLEEAYRIKKRWSVRELIHHIGGKVNDTSSILHWAARNGIPIYVPGIVDGAVGSQLWSFWEAHRDFHLDMMIDQHELSDIVFTANKTGAIMVGGGISKHHTIWWNQFRGGLDYAVYITTAPEWDGSLSGARVREAVSWGKVKEDADYITVEGDATVLLPLLVASLIERGDEND
jgi:deoxyhypusine synthase